MAVSTFFAMMRRRMRVLLWRATSTGKLGGSVSEISMVQARATRFSSRMRTPIGIIGQLEIDPLGGGCQFNKSGVRVCPAICHFAGSWHSPEYRLCDRLLRGRRSARSLFCLDRLVTAWRQSPGKFDGTKRSQRGKSDAGLAPRSPREK
jgi:hypothetical protein